MGRQWDGLTEGLAAATPLPALQRPKDPVPHPTLPETALLGQTIEGRRSDSQPSISIHPSKLRRLLCEVSRTIKHMQHRKRHPEHGIKRTEEK